MIMPVRDLREKASEMHIPTKRRVWVIWAAIAGRDELYITF